MNDNTVQLRDWKTRYLDQLEKQEADELRWREGHSQLTKALIHLSLTPVGLDSHLDDLLDHLRVRARETASGKELAAIALEISKQSEGLEDARERQRAQVTAAAESLIGSLITASDQRSLRSRLKRKLTQIRRKNPDLAGLLNDCASLLRSSVKPAEEAVPEQGQPSILDSQVDSVREALRAVRSSLKVPEKLATHASAADRLIESSTLGEQLPAALNSLGQLTARCTSFEEQRLKSFVKRIAQQFEELEAALLRSCDPELTGVDAHDEFEESLQGGFQALKATVTDNPDVELLTSLVTRQTDQLLQLVKSFRHTEKDRRTRFEASIQLLKDRLKSSKAECSELSQELTLLRKRADLDALTGLPNRAGLQDRLQQDYDLSVRHGAPVSLLLMDLDHFKTINDTFGHQAGDRVLVEIADLFKSMLRKSDYAARYGGEEFVLVLPQTGLDKATAAAEKLRIAVAERVFLFKGTRVAVTLSAGVAQLAARESIATWLKRADAALYNAKHKGRNQVRPAI